jgi:hypothetical protein
VKEALSAANVPLNAEEAVSYSFREPYDVGRFGDGTFGVCYSARAETTCIAEISYHHERQLAEQRSGEFPHDRYYNIISFDYAGDTLTLLGSDAKYPDLISPTETGYPFCQRLAKEAIGQGVEAFYTRSARDEHGTCVPIFKRRSITNEQPSARFRFFADSGQSRNERVA